MSTPWDARTYDFSSTPHQAWRRRPHCSFVAHAALSGRVPLFARSGHEVGAAALGVKQQCGPRRSLPLRGLPNRATHDAVTYADRRVRTPPAGPGFGDERN
jgi:hypothetical protein